MKARAWIYERNFINPNTSASRSNRRIIRINEESIINLNDPSTLSLANRRPFSKIQLSCHKHRSKGNYLGYELLLLLRNPFAYRERLLDIRQVPRCICRSGHDPWCTRCEWIRGHACIIPRSLHEEIPLNVCLSCCDTLTRGGRSITRKREII